MISVILCFVDHAEWDDEEIEQNLKKVFEYLNKYNIEYSKGFLSLPDRICIEIPKANFLEFCSFITEELKAPPHCIHVPYLTLCVNGDGQFELVDLRPDGMKIDDFVYHMWRKRVEFPKISDICEKFLRRNPLR